MNWLRRLNWRVIAWILFAKAVLFLFALFAVPASSGKHTGFWEMWNRWDALRYLQLAREGYLATGKERFNLVGLPLYPWLTRAVSWLGINVPLAALFVTGLASIAAGLLLWELVRTDENEEMARFAVWFFFIYPTAYFLHLAYTEATLLALVLGCFWAARQRKWWLVGLLGALASMTRLPGIIVLPAVALEAWQEYRLTNRFNRRWLWLAVVPCGLGIYLWLNYHLTGDPFAFTKYLKENFYQEFRLPWIGVRNAFGNIHASDREFAMMNGVAETFFSLLAIGLTIWSWFALRASYSIWMTGNMFLCICDNFVLSVPRYTLAMFPIFILFARASRGRPLAFAMISLPSLLLFALFASKFALGPWAF
jgi:Gpi18-like mannosyltransferase